MFAHISIVRIETLLRLLRPDHKREIIKTDGYKDDESGNFIITNL